MITYKRKFIISDYLQKEVYNKWLLTKGSL